MSFTQFLFERPDQSDEEFIREVAKTIIKDCEPFLKEVNYDARLATNLFRGVKRPPSQTFSVRNTRQSRRPTDMPPAIHKYIDDWFEHMYGFRFRSSAVFATGYAGTASHFGYVMMMFPIGNFKYIWSPAHADLFAAIRDRFRDNDDWGDQIYTRKELDFYQSEALEDILEEGMYRSDNLARAINNEVEIMINVDRYYLLSTKWQRPLHQALREELE